MAPGWKVEGGLRVGGSGDVCPVIVREGERESVDM